MKPIYTVDNTNPAYQLNWSVSLFGRIAFPPPSDWLDQLRTATEPDGVRILEFRSTQPNVGQFFVSTRPPLSPSEVVRSVKGRWQYLIRTKHPKAFRRNYFIGSVGEANCGVLDQYIAKQNSKHPMADPDVQKSLESLQFHDPSVDLGQVITGSHGQFVYGLQVVVETKDGLNEIHPGVLTASRAVIIGAGEKHRWRLSRIGLLSNHIHILLGPDVTESPADVALSLMNNLAYAQGMKATFRYSYYVGTVGPYDRNALRRMNSE